MKPVNSIKKFSGTINSNKNKLNSNKNKLNNKRDDFKLTLLRGMQPNCKSSPFKKKKKQFRVRHIVGGRVKHGMI